MKKIPKNHKTEGSDWRVTWTSELPIGENVESITIGAGAALTGLSAWRLGSPQERAQKQAARQLVAMGSARWSEPCFMPLIAITRLNQTQQRPVSNGGSTCSSFRCKALLGVLRQKNKA